MFIINFRTTEDIDDVMYLTKELHQSRNIKYAQRYISRESCIKMIWYLSSYEASPGEVEIDRRYLSKFRYIKCKL